MKTIRITDGKTTIRAVLNGTMAAKDLEKRLPFECSGSDSGIDFCCPIPRGIFDPVECQTGWKNGDICLCNGWFAILYGGEEQSKSFGTVMIVGHILEEDLPLVKEFPEQVTFTVEAEK
ncbi:cyclophilin-like fold protein [Treponema sp. JC4]|uniref:cyclophilin-like fold protein n=1 Tax=Treponema sp. JC4 TaxID=1124982 RepID=UPI0002D5D815|nr:cyclophilin-like fold protein [Treponema sp. JC4]